MWVWLFVATMAFAQPPAAQDPPPAAASQGEALFAGHCKMCHDPAAANIPSRAELAEMTPKFITGVLTDGKMRYFGMGLTDQEKAILAAYLSHR